MSMNLGHSRMTRSSKIRQKLWWAFYIVGSYITTYNIYINYEKYTNYGSVITERHTEHRLKIFPKVTFCPNSMHSRQKGLYFFHCQLIICILCSYKELWFSKQNRITNSLWWMQAVLWPKGDFFSNFLIFRVIRKFEN